MTRTTQPSVNMTLAASLHCSAGSKGLVRSRASQHRPKKGRRKQQGSNGLHQIRLAVLGKIQLSCDVVSQLIALRQDETKQCHKGAASADLAVGIQMSILCDVGSCTLRKKALDVQQMML